MRKNIRLIMTFSLLINLIFYIIEFYKSFYYDSFIFIENNLQNSRIILLNIILMIFIFVFLFKRKINLLLSAFLFSFIWLNNCFIVGAETFESILCSRYIYFEKLTFSVLSLFFLLVSIIITILLLIKSKRTKQN